MSTLPRPAVGTIGWFDLTVPDAPALRDFYAAVVGWSVSPVDMGGYEDFTMLAADGTPVAGVCCARGTNAGLPAQWLAYVTVADLEQSTGRAVELGGTILRPAAAAGPTGRFAVVRDPAGAVLALFEAAR